MMNDVAMISVLIEPRRIRNSRVDISFVAFDDMVAAWLAPNPGRREQIGEIRRVNIIGLRSSLFLNFILDNFCFGIFDVVLIEFIKVDDPKRPVSNGRSGWFTFEFNVIVPNNPDKKKIMSVHFFDFVFWESKKIIVIVRIQPIIFSINE